MDSEYVDLAKIISCKVHDGLNQSFYQDIAKTLADRIRLCGDRVPVVTGISHYKPRFVPELTGLVGYFGVVPGGLLSRIGRGYTDLCAALIAVGLKADELQVWKEVDGIFTADPRKVLTARLLPTITPAEAAELTFYGSEVRLERALFMIGAHYIGNPPFHHGTSHSRQDTNTHQECHESSRQGNSHLPRLGN